MTGAHPAGLDAVVDSAACWDVVYCPLGAAAYGGAERSLLELASAMKRRGDSVLILAERALMDTGFSSAARTQGLHIVWVDWAPGLGAWKNFQRAKRVFGALNARVLHFNISWRQQMWAVALAARMSRVRRLIGTMRAMPDPHTLVPRKRYFGLIPGLRLWHMSEVVVGWLWGRLLDRTISINARDFPVRLVRDFGYPSDRLAVIYNGIKIPDMAEGGCIGQTRREMEVGPSDFLVCYVGRLSPEKGVHVLVQALRQLDANAKLVIVGDGPQRGELEQLVDRLGLTSRIRFLGYLDDPRTVMAASDVVAVPSLWYEAFGRTVVEAMSVAVPVVASRIGGMAELFEDGVHGLYVTPDDATSLAEAFRRLMLDESGRQQMGTAARSWAMERYAAERVYEEYSKLYAAL